MAGDEKIPISYNQLKSFFFSGKNWRPREDSNLRPQDSYHFGFRRCRSIRGLDCPFAMDPEVFRRCPSSLYTFDGFLRSLARDRHAGRPAKRSPTLSRSAMAFPSMTPNFRNPVLYPAELRRQTFSSNRFVADAALKINTTIVIAFSVADRDL